MIGCLYLWSPEEWWLCSAPMTFVKFNGFCYVWSGTPDDFYTQPRGVLHPEEWK